MESMDRLDLFLGLTLCTLLKLSVIKVFVLFVVETTVAGGRFSCAMMTSCECLFVEFLIFFSE